MRIIRDIIDILGDSIATLIGALGEKTTVGMWVLALMALIIYLLFEVALPNKYEQGYRDGYEMGYESGYEDGRIEDYHGSYYPEPEY